LRVVANHEQCQSYGLCELTAPTIFRVGDNDVAEVLIKGSLPPGLAEAAAESVAACPARALTVIADDGGDR
jgi:ferredoxin